MMLNLSRQIYIFNQITQYEINANKSYKPRDRSTNKDNRL